MSNANETVTSKKERRVYPYKGANLVCFGGERYQSSEDTAIDAAFPVNKVVGEKGANSVEVTQRRPKRKGVTETWSIFLD